MKKRYHVFVSGVVQGVFFRANTLQKARVLGLTGWVRNLHDGRVEIVFEGETEAADEMLRWAHHGSPPACVSHLEVKEEQPEDSFTYFEILY